MPRDRVHLGPSGLNPGNDRLSHPDQIGTVPWAGRGGLGPPAGGPRPPLQKPVFGMGTGVTPRAHSPFRLTLLRRRGVNHPFDL